MLKRKGAFTDTRQAAMRLPLQIILACDSGDTKFASLRQAIS